jgi:hypothetical protein
VAHGENNGVAASMAGNGESEWRMEKMKAAASKTASA